MIDLCVFTTGNPEKVELLRRSCSEVGIELQTFDSPWRGYVSTKLRPAIPFLRSRHEQMAMWIDGNDSLILRGKEEILYRWGMMAVGLLISTESNCWPDAHLESKYPAHDRPRFLNAGGFIGPTPLVITAMEIVAAVADDEDDQRAWTKAFLGGHLPFAGLDYRRRIFASVSDGSESLEADSCVKHWNGKTGGRQEFYDQWHRKGMTA